MSYLGQQLGQGQAERFVYTATGGETSVTTDDAGRGIAYTVGQVDVYLNGAKLINGSDFTATTGTSITGLAALTAADVLEVFALSIFQASDTVSASVGGTFNGNITINADLTVDTNTLFVDATNNRVGVGTSSPASLLDVRASTDAEVRIGNNSDGTATLSLRNTGSSNGTITQNSGNMAFSIGASERMRIDSSGRVGIGTSTPLEFNTSGSANARLLTVYNSGTNSGTRGEIQIGSAATTTGQFVGGINFGSGASTTTANVISAIYGVTDGDNTTLGQGELRFYTAASGSNTERARIDSAGNLLVGKTAVSLTGEGVVLRPTSSNLFTRDDGLVMALNRTTTDGDILEFYKDGSTVGSIGNLGTGIYFGRSDSNIGVVVTGTGGNSVFAPSTASGALNDNSINLGASTARFKDLYLSGGVYLGGTGAANQLDDYEEGTWTGVFTDGTNNATMLGGYSTGNYTKVGNMVTVTGYFYASSLGSVSGNMFISGLPFANGSLNRNFASVSVGFGVSLNLTAGQVIAGQIDPNSSSIILNLWDAVGGTSVLQATEFSSSGGIIISATYMIS